MFGLTAEDVETAVLIWPENWPAFEIFSALRTQWRVAHCGRTGLDYGVLQQTFRLFGVKRSERREMFDAIRIMESAALEEMHKDSHG